MLDRRTLSCPKCGASDVAVHKPFLAWVAWGVALLALVASLDPAAYSAAGLPFIPLFWPVPATLALLLPFAAVLGRHRCRTCAHRWRLPTSPEPQLRHPRWSGFLHTDARPLLRRAWRFLWAILSPVVAIATSGCFAVLLAAFPLPPVRVVLALPAILIPSAVTGSQSTAMLWCAIGLFWGAATVGLLTFACWVFGLAANVRGAARTTLSWYAGITLSILLIYVTGYWTLRNADRVTFETRTGMARGMFGGPYSYVVPRIGAPGVLQLAFFPIATLEGEAFHNRQSEPSDWE
jgi:hypothetical protein